MSHFQEIILYLLPVEILVLGIIIVLLFGLFQKAFLAVFPVYKSRMRILYGYIAVIVNLISFIAMFYILNPFNNSNLIFYEFDISPFFCAIYSVFYAATTVLIFLLIVETKYNSEESYIAFIGILLVQISGYFILASTSWILIYFGFLVLFIGINLLLRYVFSFKELKEKKSHINYTLIGGLALCFMFLGIAFQYISNESFELYIAYGSQEIWNFLSIAFIFSSLLILIGCPPFHFWFFSITDNEFTSLSNLLLIVQRILPISILLKYSLVIKSEASTFFILFFIIIGSISCLWGVIASMTVDSIRKLIHYISYIHLGIMLLSFSEIFSAKEDLELQEILQSLSFHIIWYIILFSLAYSSINVIFNQYKTDKISLLKGLGRKGVLRFSLVLLSLFFLFVFPLTEVLFARFLYFQISLNFQWFVIIFVLIITIILSSVYIVRYMRLAFLEPPVTSKKAKNIEMGVNMGFLLALFLAIVATIFALIIFDLCKIMAESLTLNL